MQTGDLHRIWEASGHRDIAGWLAAKGRTSTRTARGAAALGAGLARRGALGDAADAGDISAEVAEIVAVVLDRPHDGGEADLVADVKGASPVDARAAALRFVELHQPGSQVRPSREDELRARCCLAFPDNVDGSHSVSGNLPSADARTVERVLAAIAGKPGPDDPRTYGQRLADALVQLCDAYTRDEVKGGRSNLATVLVVIGVAVRCLVWNADIGPDPDERVGPVEPRPLTTLGQRRSMACARS